MGFPQIAYGTPRKLPKASDLPGRVVVLDIAFAAETGGVSFEKVTGKFIEGLGDRLAMWIDHHDHARHVLYADDPRFVLSTKAEHPACPEMVTPERVARAGVVDTICCHIDFDGLCAAAKWIRGGEEPYPGADADARAIDTRMGEPSPKAATIDKALRAKPRDDGLKGLVVRYLVTADAALWSPIAEAAKVFEVSEREARRLADDYEVVGDVAVVDASGHRGPYDKTLLLLIGQERARIAVVHDKSTVTAAARFDSGVNLLDLFGLEGGMPTRVSVPKKRLPKVLEALGVDPRALSRG
ncbi:MAG: hypothetical protein RLO52_11515 [Sandaracinaceae bacterium]|nr:MAG: hypothetical protein EVA89_07125 [Sandaracinaceae bacterium]HBQ17482.1 hypothetical protein [Myxococcales bacterium]